MLSFSEPFALVLRVAGLCFSLSLLVFPRKGLFMLCISVQVLYFIAIRSVFEVVFNLVFEKTFHR